MRSLLLRIEGNMNSNRYITKALEPEALTLLQEAPDAAFQQDDSWPHVAKNVQALFEELRISMPPWPARSPGMSSIEHAWDMVGLHLLRCGPPATTVGDQWMRFKLHSIVFSSNISRRSLIHATTSRSPDCRT
ncbi:hypothetical protein J437_LFUL009622 [Ladona fulva]|uniref:Uncharacterized protein n=1 Tax=Ladona fulva TaxID=123851 RepID=A0A8K0P1N4_LADFU|nr:hypothetical protein J437_LFUL009622 [Ladona fulva]